MMADSFDLVLSLALFMLFYFQQQQHESSPRVSSQTFRQVLTAPTPARAPNDAITCAAAMHNFVDTVADTLPQYAPPSRTR